MRIAIIDIGSNTARLLVAEKDQGSVAALHEERAVIALGDEIERHGRISDLKLAETAERARRYARTARELGCHVVDVLVTAPGRQSENSTALIRRLERATGSPVRVLTPDEEGKLAFAGAISQSSSLPETVAVCDVGGGSTEIVAGTPSEGPALCHSLDVGSLRLTRRLLAGDPPRKKAVAAATREVAAHFDGVEVPSVETALATGGSARSLRKLAGRRLGEPELARAVKTIAREPASRLARDLALDPLRAATLLAGAIILAETQRRLGVPLEVARGGLREGAAASLLEQLAAA